MEVGDLLGPGTISGPGRDNRGSLLEMTWNGAEPMTLATGETRTFIEDGDTLALRGWARGDGFRVGVGTCEAAALQLDAVAQAAPEQQADAEQLT